MSEVECKKHEWFYDSEDELGCYPCSIEMATENRIIKLLREWDGGSEHRHCCDWSGCVYEAIELIESKANEA